MQTDSIYASIQPDDLGLPAKFTTFRHAQREALEWLMDECQTRIAAAQLPTGAGKTALAVSFAKLLGAKAVYTVATKALQQQVYDDFAPVGMVDVRGRANYACDAYGDCDSGNENECSSYDTTGCPYTRKVESAKDAELIVTNYAYWLNARKNNPLALEREGRPVGLLICDEAHALENQLTGYASVYIAGSEIDQATRSRLDDSGVMGALGNEPWGLWSVAKIKSCLDRIGKLKTRHPNDYKKLDAYKDLNELMSRAKRVGSLGANWVWQFDDRTGACTFEPINVSGYMDGLFSGVERVLLMSASLTTFQTNLLLGVNNAEEATYDYRAWNQVFPPQNAPVYHIPTRKLSWKSSDDDWRAVIACMDGVIDQRPGRRQIVQTGSYDRSKRVLLGSRHATKFIWNDKASELPGCLDRFRTGANDGILVSPSVEEGFNFPGRECEVQHFIKFPYLNETSRVVKERCTRIRGYRLHAAAQRFYQGCGRARRFESDRCETFVYDNAVAQLKGAEGRSCLPRGFHIYTVMTAPPAPPRAPNGE